MKTTSSYLLCALALIVPAGRVVLAQDPASPPQRGSIVILENDHIMQGDIEHVADQYRVRRPVGETWLPGDKVRHLCTTMDEAFAYLRSQANLDDPDECLRLARWCLLHGLRPQAQAEVKAALELRPNHADSLRLLRNLQRETTGEPPPRSREELETNAAPVPVLPYNPDSLQLFVTRVQPILMNTCAACHATGKGGEFKLARGRDEELLTNRRATQQNLMATLAQLNRDRPTQSTLLRYAITIHGDADKPPLNGRGAAAYRALEEWAQLALTNMPRPSATPDAPPPVISSPAPISTPPSADAETPAFAAQAPPPTTPAALVATASPDVPKPGPSWWNKWQPPKKEAAEQPKTTTEFAQPAPTATSAAPVPSNTEPVDPFDPVIFNRQMHPEGK